MTCKTKSHFHFFFECFSLFKSKTGETPLYIAAQKGCEQIVQILLEKGKPNVDLAEEVLFSNYFNLWVGDFSFFFFILSIFDVNVKDGRTPLYIAAQKGYDQIVQLLLEKGKPNVDFTSQVILISSYYDILNWKNILFLFFFSLSHYFYFFFFNFSFFSFFLM